MVKFDTTLLAVATAVFAFGASSSVSSQAGAGNAAAQQSHWWEPGSGERMQAFTTYPNPAGHLGVLNGDGAVETAGHPFFEPLGSNGRACVSCHQPADGMSLSLRSIQERWNETNGTDPIFAMVDGANCPNLPAGDPASHSLLLQRGLFRIGLAWPPKDYDGKVIEPEFDIEVVRDPGRCNTDPVYGLNSDRPTISVYRRPRMMANLPYVVHQNPAFVWPLNPKDGSPVPLDENGVPYNLNIMADARFPSLDLQMLDAARGHVEWDGMTPEQVERIKTFQRQLYVAQVDMGEGGSLIEEDGPPGLGPSNLRNGEVGQLGNNTTRWVIPMGDAWQEPAVDETAEVHAMRESILRGQHIFHFRTFWIDDSMHLTTVGLGNPTKRTCTTCHGMHMLGMDTANGFIDIGSTTLPWAREVPRNPWQTEEELMPLFKITCSRSDVPHPYYGRVIYTQDPGRALATGKCNDVGAIVMQQLRGLAAREPYFSNGSARTMREMIDFYDRRYNIQFGEQEKIDLGNFMNAL